MSPGCNREWETEIEACVCMCHYKQHMGGGDKKGHLIEICPVERKRMNKWCMKLFRQLLSASSHFSDHIKVKYRMGSWWCHIQGILL